MTSVDAVGRTDEGYDDIPVSSFVQQNLRSSTFPDSDVDRTLVQSCLRRGKAGHRRQEGNLRRACFYWDRHAFGSAGIRKTQRAAVEGLFVCVVKLQSADPAMVPGHSLHDDIDPDIAGPLSTVDLADVSNP